MAPRSRELGIANGEASSGGAGQPRTDSREKSARRTRKTHPELLGLVGVLQVKTHLTHFGGTPSTAPLSIGVRWWRVGPGTLKDKTWRLPWLGRPRRPLHLLLRKNLWQASRQAAPSEGGGRCRAWGRAAADGCFAQVGRRARRESEGETRRRRRSVSAIRAILTTSLQWLSSYGSRTQRGARILSGERAWLSGALASCVS